MSLKINLIANYLGQGWTGFIGLAFVPLYIKYLGGEAYGLIGVYTLLQAWLTLTDMGMTPTLNREMARFTAGAHSPQSINDLLRSLEVVCIVIAGAIGLLVWGGSAWLASSWLQVDKLPVTTVSRALFIMGWVAALKLIESIYRGAILGLQRQVFFNVASASLATLRAAGALVVLAGLSATIEAYFLWQGIVSLVSVSILAVAAHRSLPAAPRAARFSRQALLEIRRFAGGMMIITLLALLLTQVDKIILSRLLSLENFGYYTLAATVAAAVTLVITPITQAFYPRFTELVALGETRKLVDLYHQSSNLVTALAAPGALILIFFGRWLLVAWTGDEVLAKNVSPLLTLLAIGTLLNGMMHIPYMLQLAYGWAGFAVRVNTVAVAVLAPAVLWATPRYGAIGAACVWLLLNIGYVLIAIHYMHRRLLAGEKWKWYRNAFFNPLFIGATAALALCKWVPPPHDRLSIAAYLIGIWCLLFLVVGLTMPAVRKIILFQVKPHSI